MNKKEKINQYKQTALPMGIFQIKNYKNGKVFIDSAINLTGKINRNKFQLKNNLHPLKEMQKDYNEDGGRHFTFEILDYLKPKEKITSGYDEELKILLDLWLEKLLPYGEKGYNVRKE
jgi:hypothetical protein